MDSTYESGFIRVTVDGDKVVIADVTNGESLEFDRFEFCGIARAILDAEGFI